MIFIGGLVKNLFKKIFGEKALAYLGQIRCAISPFNIRGMIVLKYHFIRLRISKQIRNPLTVPIKAELNSTVEAREKNRVSMNVHKNVISRMKPHILLLSEKWCEHNPEFGPSLNDHSFFGSLEASDLATYDRLNYDEYCQNHRPFDTGVLLRCIKNKPDIIVIINWFLSPLQFKTMKLIKERLQIPIVVIWGDSVNHMEEAESLLPFVEINLVLDSSTAYLRRTNQPEKYLLIWSPWDPRIFYNPDLNRDIDVCFLGTMANYPDRLAGISALKLNGIDVYQTGGQRECRLPVDEYARTYMRTKIALNFCYHPNGMAQSKGRVFEVTLCGAMLLEADNSETARWLEPMVDYVPFTDETDLVEKVRYYLAHDSERMEIAAKGHQKAKEIYSGEMFWKTIFKRVFSQF